MGKVYEGSSDDGEAVAVKRIDPVIGTTAEGRRHREVEIGELISSYDRSTELRNVLVPIDHVVAEDNSLLIVMPKATRSLAKALITGRLDGVFATETMLQVAAGLGELHGLGILHRDLKAANVLELHGRWVLADFGISRSQAAPTAPHTFLFWGTPQYMAPELWEGKSATVKSDLYALGVLYYEILAGSLPFAGPDFSNQHQVQIPAELDSVAPALARITMRLLRKASAERPQDVRAVVQAIESNAVKLSPAQQALAVQVQRAERMKMEQDAAHAERVNSAKLEQSRVLQAASDLQALLEEACDYASAVLPEIVLRYDGAQFYFDWTDGSVIFTPWRHSPPLGSQSDRLVTGGSVHLYRGNTTQSSAPVANIICESVDDRLTWSLIEFEVSPLIQRDRYTLGPVDQPHGFTESAFFDQLPYILRPVTHIWQMRKRALNSDGVIELISKAI